MLNKLEKLSEKFEEFLIDSLRAEGKNVGKSYQTSILYVSEEGERYLIDDRSLIFDLREFSNKIIIEKESLFEVLLEKLKDFYRDVNNIVLCKVEFIEKMDSKTSEPYVFLHIKHILY